jgi:hypothetical protein
MKLLEKNQNMQAVFSTLGDADTDENVKAIESFVCEMYGKKRGSVNELRFGFFLAKYKPKKTTGNLVNQVKNMDFSLSPPCSKVLLEKIKRSTFVTSVWQHSAQAESPITNPTDFGWSLEDGRYVIHWFDGEAAPKIVDVVKEKTEDDFGKLLTNYFIMITL